MLYDKTINAAFFFFFKQCLWKMQNLTPLACRRAHIADQSTESRRSRLRNHPSNSQWDSEQAQTVRVTENYWEYWISKCNCEKAMSHSVNGICLAENNRWKHFLCLIFFSISSPILIFSLILLLLGFKIPAEHFGCSRRLMSIWVAT